MPVPFFHPHKHSPERKSNPHPVFVPPSVADKKGPEIDALGEEVLSDQIFAWVTDSEKNKPYVKGDGRDSFGKFKGELVVGEGWRKLQEFGIKKGHVVGNPSYP